MLLGRLWQQIHIGFSLFNFRALMQINTRYKRVLYMVTLPDPFTSWPASLPAAYRQRRALLAVGRIVDKLSPGEPGLRLRRLWSLFVSLYALAAVAYAEAVGCEPNLPKTSTLFCVESFECIKRTHLTVYKYTMGVHILPSTLSVEFLFHTFCESVPKSASEWEEANAFFRAAFSAAPFLSIENLDDFTNIFQSTIYNYFAENYGTTSERKTDEKELDAMSVKELKKKLSGLKKFGEKGEEIHRISKLIRSKLRGHTNTANPQPEKQEPSLNEQFRDNFWKTCERIFKPGENILPMFSVGSGPSTLNQYSATNRIQSHITHVQNTSILATLILTSVVHHPTTSFNPILIHCNTTSPFCPLVTQIFQSLHSRSCPASLEQTPASIATNI